MRRTLHHPELIVGQVSGGLRVAPADAALTRALQQMAVEPSRRGGDAATRAAIRDLLRGHGYKPTGRGKPASEFLTAAAERGELPAINNIVDINNLVSLESGLPISVFDLDLAAAGGSLELRFGHAGETFAFNAAAQSIDVSGLICVARVDGPAIGNPVKDSMLAKVHDATARFLAVIYGSTRVLDAPRMRHWCERFATLARAHAAASDVRTEVR